MLCAELEKHERAIEIFDKILKEHKDNVSIIYAKSRSKAALKQYPQALELLRQAVSKNSKVIRAWAREESIFKSLHTNSEFRRIVRL